MGWRCSSGCAPSIPSGTSRLASVYEDLADLSRPRSENTSVGRAKPGTPDLHNPAAPEDDGPQNTPNQNMKRAPRRFPRSADFCDRRRSGVDTRGTPCCNWHHIAVVCASTTTSCGPAGIIGNTTSESRGCRHQDAEPRLAHGAPHATLRAPARRSDNGDPDGSSTSKRNIATAAVAQADGGGTNTYGDGADASGSGCTGLAFTSPGEHPSSSVNDKAAHHQLEGRRRRLRAARRGVPVSWSLNATNIVAQKYFRGTLGTPERERSLRQVIDRVADTIARGAWPTATSWTTPRPTPSATS